MRPTSILWLGVILMTGVAVFSVKAAVAGLEEELLRVRKEIARDHEAIHVLNAEWSYLNQPTRLAELAKRHLPQLQPIATVQYGDASRLELLPWRPDATPETAATSGGALASADPLPTPTAKPREKRVR
jgi:cell division protein FtsL